MTYAELAAYIGCLTPEQREMDVTVYVTGVDEYYGLAGEQVVEATEEIDTLDPSHPYLVV